MSDAQTRKLIATISIVVGLLTVGGVLASWLVGSVNIGRAMERMASDEELEKCYNDLAKQVGDLEDDVESELKELNDDAVEYRQLDIRQTAIISTRIEDMSKLLQEVRDDVKVVLKNGHNDDD